MAKNSIDNSDLLNGADYRAYSYCIPNPADDNFDIHFISHDKGKVSLKIIDILGNLIYDTDKSKNSEELIITIKNSKMLVGQYYYQLLINNNIESNGIIQILH